MNIVHVKPYPRVMCNAPKGCDEFAEWLVTLTTELNGVYKTYHLCTGCKDRAVSRSESE